MEQNPNKKMIRQRERDFLSNEFIFFSNKDQNWTRRQTKCLRELNFTVREVLGGGNWSFTSLELFKASRKHPPPPPLGGSGKRKRMMSCSSWTETNRKRAPDSYTTPTLGAELQNAEVSLTGGPSTFRNKSWVQSRWRRTINDPSSRFIWPAWIYFKHLSWPDGLCWIQSFFKIILLVICVQKRSMFSSDFSSKLASLKPKTFSLNSSASFDFWTSWSRVKKDRLSLIQSALIWMSRDKSWD